MKIRDEFEKIARKKGYNLDRDIDGVYKSFNVDSVWHGYQVGFKFGLQHYQDENGNYLNINDCGNNNKVY